MIAWAQWVRVRFDGPAKGDTFALGAIFTAAMFEYDI